MGLVAAASGALNQYVERKTDAKMIRTANRPLPAGRLTPNEALAFGLGTGIAGTGYLAYFVNGPTAILSATTLLLYVLAYTPLKRMSSFCTLVGAIPGAMPPVLGWAAAGGGEIAGPISLFGILFLWQFPHLYAIAWLYRQQYADAGLHMLPGQFPPRRLTGLLAIGYALGPCSDQPAPVGLGTGGRRLWRRGVRSGRRISVLLGDVLLERERADGPKVVVVVAALSAAAARRAVVRSLATVLMRIYITHDAEGLQPLGFAR